MATYSIEVSRTAEKQLTVLKAVVAFADDPYPKRARMLTGYDDVFRIRIRRYRVIHSVYRKKLIVIILKVGHREDVYR